MSGSIYTGGSMEAYDGTNKAVEWRERVKEYFKGTDLHVISPPDYYAYGDDKHLTEKEPFRFDLRKVKESDVVLINLDNIRKSVGTIQEIMYAYMLDKPIIGFLEDALWEDGATEYVEKVILHPWIIEECDRIELGKDALEKACEYINYYYGG